MPVRVRRADGPSSLFPMEIGQLRNYFVVHGFVRLIVFGANHASSPSTSRGSFTPRMIAIPHEKCEYRDVVRRSASITEATVVDAGLEQRHGSDSRRPPHNESSYSARTKLGPYLES